MATADAESKLSRNAKSALERICSGAALEAASTYYSPEFVDHVNATEFRGLEGVERSVASYKAMLDDIQIVVKDQVARGDRVASRFVVSGTKNGRPVSFNGITISRFRDGLIVEDWSVIDTLSMLRQLDLLPG
jgi:predicted ester cyclase